MKERRQTLIGALYSMMDHREIGGMRAWMFFNQVYPGMMTPGEFTSRTKAKEIDQELSRP